MRFRFGFLVAISLAIRVFSLTGLRCLGQFHAAPFCRVLVRLIEYTCFAMMPPYGQATHVKPIPRIGCSHYHEEETRQPIHRSAVSLAYRLPMPRRQMGGVCVTPGNTWGTHPALALRTALLKKVKFHSISKRLYTIPTQKTSQNFKNQKIRSTHSID